MRILLFGEWRENAGPANVNESLIKHADNSLLYIKSQNNLLEVMAKLIMADVIVFSGYGGMKMFKLAKRLGKKVAILKHGDLKHEGEANHTNVPQDQIDADFQRQDMADLIICVSERYAAWVEEHYPQYKGKISWINNGVEIHRRLKVRKEPNLIAVGGGNRYVKNNINVCRAIEKLNSHEYNLKLRSFGFVYEGIPSLSSFPFVEVMGQMDKDAYYAELDKVNLYIDAAYYEPFGLSMTDALVCNCSLLVSENVGFLSIVKSEETDVVHDCENVDEIAEKIKYLLNHSNSDRLLKSINPETSSEDYAYKRLKWICQGLKDGKILR